MNRRIKLGLLVGSAASICLGTVPVLGAPEQERGLGRSSSGAYQQQTQGSHARQHGGSPHQSDTGERFSSKGSHGPAVRGSFPGGGFRSSTKPPTGGSGSHGLSGGGPPRDVRSYGPSTTSPGTRGGSHGVTGASSGPVSGYRLSTKPSASHRGRPSQTQSQTVYDRERNSGDNRSRAYDYRHDYARDYSGGGHDQARGPGAYSYGYSHDKGRPTHERDHGPRSYDLGRGVGGHEHYREAGDLERHGERERYDWSDYRPGHRPPKWDYHHRHFDPGVYQHNWYAEHRYHWHPYVWPNGWHHYRRWVYGEYLPRIFWVRDYWLFKYWRFGLFDPPYGYVWVRYGNDALLVNVETGRILAVVYDLFE